MTRTLRFLMLSALITYVGADPVIAEPLRVGIPGLSAEFAPVWAANDRGLLKKYGFESEIIAMQGGTQLAQAVIGASIPIAVMGGAYLTAAVRGADLVMIATHMDKFPYSLIVKPNIKKVEDLKGTKLAISRFGYIEGVKELKTDKEFAIAVMAKHLRLDRKKDREALEDSFKEVVIEQMLKIPSINLEAIKVGLDLLGKDKPARASSNPRDYVDSTLMQELVKSGFTEQLYK